MLLFTNNRPDYTLYIYISISANIPLNKLSIVKFLKCLEVYCGKDIPTESVLRKFYVDDCYSEIMKKIRQRVFDRKIWLSPNTMYDNTAHSHIKTGELLLIKISLQH